MKPKELFIRFKKSMNQRVLLCDLDGTLICTKSGDPFPRRTSDWTFKPGIKEAILAYDPRFIFIITNQGGIEKGYIKEMDFRNKLYKICRRIEKWGNFIVCGAYCKSIDPNDQLRKPNIGMIDLFRYAFAMGYDFSNSQALMIGDASGKPGQFGDSDLQCAKNAGIRYCDVDDFIEAMCPNFGHEGCIPPYVKKPSARLKRALLYNGKR